VDCGTAAFFMLFPVLLLLEFGLVLLLLLFDDILLFYFIGYRFRGGLPVFEIDVVLIA
jgi:hypothetical protein